MDSTVFQLSRLEHMCDRVCDTQGLLSVLRADA
jgi:hypothetical protein